MKQFLLAVLLGTAAVSASAVDVGVSVGIGAPNFYGAVDIGGYPPPQLIYPSPVMIQPSVGIAVAPLYLRVPYGHRHNWRRYCNIYQACGRPVYFIHDNWYNNVYAPRYRNEHTYHHEEMRHEERRHEEMRHEDHHGHDDHHDHDRH